VVLLVNEHPFVSTIVREYVPAVNPVISICCGSFGTLSDQLNENGGSPDVMNAVIFPLFPLPHEVLNKE
jgi:hypothetical protein